MNLFSKTIRIISQKLNYLIQHLERMYLRGDFVLILLKLSGFCREVCHVIQL